MHRPPGESTVPAAPLETRPGSARPAGGVQTVGEAPTLGDPDAIPGPGERIGGFVVERVLGAGAMGVVLLAQDPDLHRKVAIKLLMPHAGATERAQQRLLREAQSVAALSHPNVVGLHQVGMIGARVYAVMEYVDGGTLRQWVAAQARAWPDIVDKYRQAAAGLAAAHAAGFVHRDFKPDNVLIGRDGRVRVSDFGLVGASGQVSTTGEDAPITDVRLTQTGAVLGTPAYMAPEQFLGTTVDAAADQFALCVSLYEALHGRRPFAGNTAGSLLLNAQTGEILPPLRRDVPARVHRVITRGLAAAPRQRHASVAALSEALGAAMAGGRSRTSVALAAVGVLAVAGSATWWWAGGTAPAAASASEAASDAEVGVGPGAAACAPATAVAVAAWNEAARARLQPLVRAAGIARPKLLLDGLDAEIERRAAALGEAIAGTCRLAAELDPETLAARRRCLDAETSDFVTTVEIVATTDSPLVARDGVGVVAGLPDPSHCDEPPPERSRGTDTTPRAEDPATRRLVLASQVHERSGDLERARTLATEAMTAARAGDDTIGTCDASWSLGRLSFDDPPTAEGHLRRAQTLARSAGDARREWGTTLHLARAIASQGGRTDEAIALVPVADAAALRSHDRGTWSFDLATAELYRAAGKPETARSHAAAAVDRLTAMPHPPVFGLVLAWRQLADANLRTGAPDRADATYVAAIEWTTERLGPDHPARGDLMLARATALTHLQRFDEAVELYGEAERIFAPPVGSNPGRLGECLLARADAERQRGRFDRGADAAARAIALLEGDPTQAEALANALVVLGIIEFQRSELPAARTSLERAWTIAQRHPESRSIAVLHLLSVLGAVELARGDIDAAVARHEQALRWVEKRYGPAHATVATASANVGDMQMVAGRPDEARRAYAKALGIRADLELPPDAELVRILAASARCSAADGELDRAREAAARVAELMDEGIGVPDYEPRASMMHAEIAWQEGRRADARAFAEEAARRWRAIPNGAAAELADVERWLDEHPA